MQKAGRGAVYRGDRGGGLGKLAITGVALDYMSQNMYCATLRIVLKYECNIN